MALSKGKKIAIGLGGAVLVGGIVAGGVYVANTETSKNVKQELENNDYYKNLNDDEKKDFDDKLNKIVSSGEYKSLDKTQKEELVDKFVESEKLQKEMAEEVKTSDEVKTEINDLNNNLDSIKNELESLKQNGASAEEISQIEQKQQECEDQIKSAEQEKAYLETNETIKNTIEEKGFKTNTVYENNEKLVLKKITGIYKSSGTIRINADFIHEETINGVKIFSVTNNFFTVSGRGLLGNESYTEILDIISNTQKLTIYKECQNVNDPSHIQIFEQNEEVAIRFNELKSRGYTFDIISSWETDNNVEHPEFVVQATKNEDVRVFMITYNSFENKYNFDQISKICPEFWAQLEKENAAAQSEAQNEQMSAKNIIQSLSTKDSSGNLTGFDWAAYKNLQQKTTASQQTTTSASAPDFSFDLDSTLCL